MSRELRQLVPFEIAAVIGLAVAPLPERIPIALPLVVAATIARWIRGRSWAELATDGTIGNGRRWLIGMTVGVVALAIAAVASNQGAAALSGRAEWSEYAVVRGNSTLLVVVLVQVAVSALAAELALRGWIVERVLELAPGSPILPVIVGALAEAVVTPGDPGTRLAAGLFGAGFGWLYVAGGRNVLAPIAARIVFQGGAVLIEALQLM